MIFDSKKMSEIAQRRKAIKEPEAPKVEMDGRHLAAQELMNAIHEKSPEKLMKALASFQDIHAAMIKNDEE